MRPNFYLALILITLAIIIGASHVATAATIEVHPGESIQDAVNSANSGDVIVIHSGQYNESITIDGKSDLIIKAAEGEKVIINIPDDEYIIIENSKDIMLKDLEIRGNNTYRLVRIEYSTNITLEHLTIKATTDYDKLVDIRHSGNVTIANSTLISLESYTSVIELSLDYSPITQHYYIYNNTITGDRARGIDIDLTDYPNAEIYIYNNTLSEATISASVYESNTYTGDKTIENRYMKLIIQNNTFIDTEDPLRITGELFAKVRRGTLQMSNIQIIVKVLHNEFNNAQEKVINIELKIKGNSKDQPGLLKDNKVEVHIVGNNIITPSDPHTVIKAYADVSGVNMNATNNTVIVNIKDNTLGGIIQSQPSYNLIEINAHIWINDKIEEINTTLNKNLVYVEISNNTIDEIQCLDTIHAETFIGVKLVDITGNTITLTDNNVTLIIENNSFEQVNAQNAIWGFTYIGVNYNTSNTPNTIILEENHPRFLILQNDIEATNNIIYIPAFEKLPATDNCSVVTPIVKVNYNNFYIPPENRPYGIYVEDSNVVPEVNASYNYWGDYTGPYTRDTPEHSKVPGKGVIARGNVNIKPWLNAPYPDGEPLEGTGEAFSGSSVRLWSFTTDYHGIPVTFEFLPLLSSPYSVAGIIFTEGQPVPVAPEINIAMYFDVYLSTSASSGQLNFTIYYGEGLIPPNLEDKASLLWWDGSEWKPVSYYKMDPENNKITVIFNATSSPSFTQLKGTTFVLVYNSSIVGGELAQTQNTTPEPYYIIIAGASAAAIILLYRKLH